MKKVFFALLFLSVAGAGVLVWLIRSAPPAVEASKDHALQIVDEKHEEAGKAAEKAEGHEGEEAEGEGEEHAAAGHEAAAAHAAPAEHAEEGHAKPESEHAESHDEKPSEKHAAKSEATHEDAKAAPALSLTTEPPMAKVWVDGKYRGTTPLEIGLKAKGQKVEIKADGFEDFSREAPSAKESGNGELNWRIQLKQSAAEAKTEAAKEEAEEHTMEHAADAAAGSHAQAAAPAHGHADARPKAASAPKKHAAETHASVGLYRRGKVGPFVIQFKSVQRLTGEEASIQGQIARYRQELGGDEKVFGCPIDLKEKGPWVRILVGPFASRALAREKLSTYKANVPDAFVAGMQNCRP